VLDRPRQQPPTVYSGSIDDQGRRFSGRVQADTGAGTEDYRSTPVTRWYRSWFDSAEGLGLSLLLRPFIFTPQDVPLVIDEELALAVPALAVFAAICHGGDADIDKIFPALAAVLRSVDPQQAILYYDIVLAGLPRAPRARWEEYVNTPVGYKFRSELFHQGVTEGKAQGVAEGEARGKAEGESQAVLTVLEARGVPVPEAIRKQILGCTDLAQLDTWLRRAVTATTAAEVIRP
jgi:hypothetical protein